MYALQRNQPAQSSKKRERERDIDYNIENIQCKIGNMLRVLNSATTTNQTAQKIERTNQFSGNIIVVVVGNAGNTLSLALSSSLCRFGIVSLWWPQALTIRHSVLGLTGRVAKNALLLLCASYENPQARRRRHRSSSACSM